MESVKLRYSFVLLFFVVSITTNFFAHASPIVFINEIHYDNVGADVSEGIELLGESGTNLNGWKLTFYNGNTNKKYRQTTLDGIFQNQSNGLGAIAFLFPSNYLQNGPSDGVALIDPLGVVRQFLSYEGTITAIDGEATGQQSEDIGVSEDNTTPLSTSMQLTGFGTSYQDFSWQSGLKQSFGLININQQFPTKLKLKTTDVSEPNIFTLFTIALLFFLVLRKLRLRQKRLMTSFTPGTFCFTKRSTTFFKSITALGQPTQAPFIRT